MAPDPGERGLDPAHILAVCGHATSGTGSRPVLAVTQPDGVRACLPSRPAGRDARAALARVGYQVATAGNGRDLRISGWSPEGLEARLGAMRAVLHQLAEHPSVTAQAVIVQFRKAPGGSPSYRPGPQLLEQAQAGLRAWVTSRSSIHAPHDPSVQPADVGNALRLRAAWTLEAAIDDLIERHLRVAGHALALYSSLSQQMSGDRAQDTAIRRAGVTFHLSGSTAQDSSSLLLGIARPPGPGAPPPSRLPSRPRALPNRTAGRDLPATGPGTSWAAGPSGSAAARRGGRRFPVARPGHRPHR
jgi:hypothetical protein